MQNTAITRRTNLRRIALEFRSNAELADRLDRSEQQINGLIGKNPTRNIGNRLAREIESKLGLDTGTLDVPAHDSDEHIELLARSIELVENALAGRSLSPHARAIAIVFVYEELKHKRTPDKETVGNVVQLNLI